METKVQIGAEPTPEERKHLEECRRDEMKLLENKGDAPDSAVEKDDITYATVKVNLPHAMRPIYKKCMERICPPIIEIISDEIANLLSAIYEELTDNQKGDAK